MVMAWAAAMCGTVPHKPIVLVAQNGMQLSDQRHYLTHKNLATSEWCRTRGERRAAAGSPENPDSDGIQGG